MSSRFQRSIALGAVLLGVAVTPSCTDRRSASSLDAGVSAQAIDAALELIDAAAMDAAVEAGAADGGDAAAPSEAPLPGTTEGCSDGMVLVAGDYCPSVLQKCLEEHEEYKNDVARKRAKRAAGQAVTPSTVSERCMRYEEPSQCLSSERRPMRYCMDRYEYPNKKGELPALLISWVDAKKACEGLGKRLCTEDEFNFACEGEAMLPYTNGYVRDPEACSIDKSYRKRERKLYKYDKCMRTPACKAELEKLDQRLPAGSMPRCVSPFGVYDMNGNINEWVYLPGKKYPDRSGLKGGWWGPVRNRCRPTVGFHKEEDYGYEAGFRCCQDARP